MNTKIIIGIDCGLDGGIVTLDSAGNIIDQRVMPVVALGKGRKIDLAELSGFLLGLNRDCLGYDNIKQPTIMHRATPEDMRQAPQDFDQ